jgi:predicted DCC family thiol-disulfide oxidoreductase YuxK
MLAWLRFCEQTRSPRLFSLRSDAVVGRLLAEQLSINPDRPDSFAFVANGQASVKSEAARRIACELPRWQWTWLFHFIPRVIRDAIYDLVARNRYRWFGRVTLASCRIQIVRGDREPPRDRRTMAPGAGRGQQDKGPAEDLVDQLFNSSEKRLARALLLLANFGKDGRPEPVIAKVSQETLAEMIGTTRSRVSHFMNKFRNLGFIGYNGGIEVHSSLLNVVLHDQPQIKA